MVPGARVRAQHATGGQDRGCHQAVSLESVAAVATEAHSDRISMLHISNPATNPIATTVAVVASTVARDDGMNI